MRKENEGFICSNNKNSNLTKRIHSGEELFLFRLFLIFINMNICQGRNIEVTLTNLLLISCQWYWQTYIYYLYIIDIFTFDPLTHNFRLTLMMRHEVTDISYVIDVCELYNFSVEDGSEFITSSMIYFFGRANFKE